MGRIGWCVRSFTQWDLLNRVWQHKRLIAVLFGVVLAAGPLVAFDFWLGDLVERQAQEDSVNLANRSVQVAEARISRAVASLNELAGRGVDSCTPAQRDLMRRSVLAAVPVKNIQLLDADGRLMCSPLGAIAEQQEVVAGEPLANEPGFMLEIVRGGEAERFVRVRRSAPGPAAADTTSNAAPRLAIPSLVALIPADLMVPLATNPGGAHPMFARVHSEGGMLLTESPGAAEQINLNDAFVGRARSERYGISAFVILPRLRDSAAYRDLSKISLFVPAAIALLIITFAALIPRRQPANPVADLQRAIESGQIVPYFQPVVDIRSGRLVGAEVLARWRKPDGSLVMPGSFIPLAESSGLIIDITKRLMRQVCADVGPAIGRRPGFKIGFNFTAVLFSNRNIIRDVRSVFAGSPIALSQVVLELTEREPIADLTETRQVIAALQGIGVRIAIDDVGTGHSGLSYMLKLGVDIIKIDKMFVDALGSDSKSVTIVETLVDLARNMRMDIVAEGVENFEQVAHLREIGIRSAQGFVFAPPLPGSAFLQLLEAIDPIPASAAPAQPHARTRRYLSARSSTLSA